MRALVVYESMFGDTERVAHAIADGLRDTYQVDVADVGTMPSASGVDLLVVGGPTHAFAMTKPATRAEAAKRGAVRTGAIDLGIREWLDCSPTLNGTAAAAFDTKIDKPYLPGSAAHKAHRQLHRLGCHMLMHSENFRVIGTTGPLVAGEEQRARRWGSELAAAASAAHHKI